MVEDNFLAYLGYCEIKSPTPYSYYDVPLYTFNSDSPAQGQYLSIVLPGGEDSPTIASFFEECLRSFPLKVGSFMSQLSPLVTCPFIYLICGPCLILCPIYLYSRSIKLYKQNLALFNNSRLTLQVKDDDGNAVFGLDIYDAIHSDMLGDSNHEEMIYYSYNQLADSLTNEIVGDLVTTVIENLIN